MSIMSRGFGRAAIVAIGIASGTAAQADAVVNVTLIDKVGEANLGQSLQLGMGMDGDTKAAEMGVNLSPKSVPRGKITFNVTNLASSLVHEVIVAGVSGTDQKLHYDPAKSVVDEETIQTLGQVSEIYPNKTASVTIDLKPGTYILYCNYPGHYMAGMWNVIEVK